MKTPRYLNGTTSSSTSPNRRFFDFFTFRPKPTILNFLLVMTSLFLEHQFSIFFKSLLSFSSISKIFTDVKFVVLSAKKLFLNYLEQFEADH